MVTSTHEVSHRLLQEHPEALAPVFEALRLPPPVKQDFGELSPDTTEIRPLERRVDTVLKFEPDMGESFLLAVESQTKKDPDKARSWSYYVAYLSAKFDMPVLLVIVCRDRATAAWAMGPFECAVGPWSTQTTRPFVLGPQTVPKVTDTSMVTRQPALSALSAIVHSGDRRADAILDTVAHGFASLAPHTMSYWFELVEIGLENTPTKQKWRDLMSFASHFPGSGTLIEETYLEGKAEGKAEDILRALQVRGLTIPDSVHERITTCTDLDTLTAWFDRSLTATTAEDVLKEGPTVPTDASEQP
ncbi:hypothetical protein OHB56_20760 [Streptomyces sp. NBC_01635]|uniref:hypothetical protein n=1 Tax=Streptomyces TaxID=1883 RepID=UPI003324E17A|nr:hypothetical protein OHB56_20760 [Streptomyces sp. NBC_01635]